MARRSIPIEEKIETQKELVSKAKDRYEAELDKLEKLMRKRDECLFYNKSTESSR